MYLLVSHKTGITFVICFAFCFPFSACCFFLFLYFQYDIPKLVGFSSPMAVVSPAV